MNKQYLTNANYIMDRQADYETLEKLREKFKPVKEDIQSGNGNLAGFYSVNRKTKKLKLNKSRSYNFETDAGLYAVISSSLALYRLCAYDGVTVHTYGQEAYKCVWSVGLVHEATGVVVHFGEHKGGFSFWTQYASVEDAPKDFIKDLTMFLEYLISDNFAHPYDGLVAGSVA
ncbi:MAG: hypothetical protein ACK41T_03705 [Pseudobdellovibrio sp.]